MNILRKFLLLIIVFVTAAGVAGKLVADDQQVQLRLKLNPGELYKISTQSISNIEVETPLFVNALIYQAMGMQPEGAPLQSKAIFDFNLVSNTEFEVLAVDEEGNTTISLASKDMQIDFKGFLQEEIKFSGEIKNIDKKIVVKLVTPFRDYNFEHLAPEPEELRLLLGPDGKVIAINGVDPGVLIMQFLNVAENQSINQEELLKFLDYAQSRDALPQGLVKQGESWSKELVVNILEEYIDLARGIEWMPLNIGMKNTKKVVALDENFITFVTDSEIVPKKIKWGAKLDQNEVSFDISGDSNSAVTVDVTTGVPKSSAADLRMKGEFSMRIFAGKQETTFTSPFDTKIHTVVEVQKIK